MEVIPAWLRKIWNTEELRVLVLLSLAIQIFLIFFAIFRKNSASRSLSAALWLFYLSADYVATLALGNLLNNLNGDVDISGDGDLLAFWAPFLLLHLGGPDAITAYSIEDNELWWRHLLGLVIQVAAAVMVFLLSVPSTRLWKAAVPVYLAGILKYAERTLALRSASMDTLMDSMTPPPDPGPSYAKFMEEYTSQLQAGLKATIDPVKEPESRSVDVGVDPNAPGIRDSELMSKAYHFFQTFKRLIVDLILSFHDRAENQSFFLRCSPVQAFKVIEIELSFVFDVLYTKAALVHTSFGRLARCVSFGMIIVSLVFFYNVKKGDYKETDIIVTYVLLLVAVWLESVSIFLLVSSDWAFIWLSDLSQRNVLGTLIFRLVSFFKLPIKSRWSNCMPQYNLMSSCLRNQPIGIDKITRWLRVKNIWENLVMLRDTKRIEVSDAVKVLIFNELKEKAEGTGKDSKGYKRFNTCRGEWVLQLKGYRKTLGWSIESAELDESILLWHIATDLCYHTEQTDVKNEVHDDHGQKWRFPFHWCMSRKKDQKHQEEEPDYREMSRDMSNYMLYLLLQRPFMLTVGIGKIRFNDTCAEAKKFFQQEEFALDKEEAKKLPKQIKKTKELEWASKLLLDVETRVEPIQVKGDRSKSVLFDACRLAKGLQAIEPPEKRWRLVSAVWAEMLCFTATQCRGNVHAKQLSSGGGEFLTHVWFLIAHMGMGAHYRIEAGHARAKLIVEK